MAHRENFVLKHDGQTFSVGALKTESDAHRYQNDHDTWFGLSRDEMFHLKNRITIALGGDADDLELDEDGYDTDKVK